MSAELGYDGKGQVRIGADTELAEAWAAMRGHAAGASGIVEAIVEFRMEVSVIVARSADGSLRSYVPVENSPKDRKSVESCKGMSTRVDLGGFLILKHKTN